MSSDRDVTRIVRSWLEEGATALPHHVLDAVLDQVPATTQRRTWWPARRFAQMHAFAKVAIAAAALLVVTTVGLSLLPDTPDLGGPPDSVTASPTESASPSESPVLSDLFPPSGRVLPGSYAVRVGDVRWSFDVAASDWYSDGKGFLTRGSTGWNARADAAMLDLITEPLVRFGIYSDPCGEVPAPALINPTATEVVQELTRISGVTATEPAQVTLGGLPAQYVVLTVPDSIDCDGVQPTIQAAGEFYYLWYSGQPDDCNRPEGCYRYATVPPAPGMEKLGSTIHVWIVESGGSLYWIEGETFTGATPDVTQEFQAIVDSLISE